MVRNSVVAQATGVVVLTRNSRVKLQSWIRGLRSQRCRPEHVLVIDSGSDDGTVAVARDAGLPVHSIDGATFNHGATRQLAVELLPDCSVLVFTTDDAVLATPDSLCNLVRAFENAKVGAAYGRQLPKPDATPIEAHARLFNYPAQSQLKTLDSAHHLGIKTPFLSNSFSAYRRSALLEVGGFPDDVVLCEDVSVGASMLLAGWAIAYVAGAAVFHSHSYSTPQLFRRYFDLGVFYSRSGWIRQSFGTADAEGVRFLTSEIRYVAVRNPNLLLAALLQTAAKGLGYKLGSLERFLPTGLKTRLSMHGAFWQGRNATADVPPAKT